MQHKPSQGHVTNENCSVHLIAHNTQDAIPGGFCSSLGLKVDHDKLDFCQCRVCEELIDFITLLSTSDTTPNQPHNGWKQLKGKLLVISTHLCIVSFAEARSMAGPWKVSVACWVCCHCLSACRDQLCAAIQNNRFEASLQSVKTTTIPIYNYRYVDVELCLYK